jgi:hypothetical protein
MVFTMKQPNNNIVLIIRLRFAVNPAWITAFSGFVLMSCLRCTATPPGKTAFFGSVFIFPFTD